jgi:uncharacterized heparinase superfamily protein
MQRWLGTMLMPDGEVPLLNDCAPVGRDRIVLLRPAPPGPRPLAVLEPSGYVVVRRGSRLHLVADVGPPCPPNLPAHAHADSLSFELAVDGERLVVDTGTSTYEPGAVRAYERSTAAHNTVEIDGADSTEVWATFRAGRRARARLDGARADHDAVEVSAAHDGYRRLRGRPTHHRTWRVSDQAVEVTDEVMGTGSHQLVGRLHLAPGLAARVEEDGTLQVGALRIASRGAPTSAETDAPVASGFGRRDRSTTVRSHASGALPRRWSTRIELASEGA